MTMERKDEERLCGWGLRIIRLGARAWNREGKRRMKNEEEKINWGWDGGMVIGLGEALGKEAGEERKEEIWE